MLSKLRLVGALALALFLGISCTDSCPPGRTHCGEACIELLNDPQNCGACGTVCVAPTGGSAACGAGVCGGSCPAGKTLCGGACVDVQGDPDHCGACGKACARPPGGSASCEAGSCGLSCEAGKLLCDGSCVDPKSDAKHCGACGTRCEVPAGGEAGCVDATCTKVCTEGTSLCSGACVNQQSDVMNCGGCGALCEAGWSCRLGVCRAPAPLLSAITPADGHAKLSTPVTISGQNLLRPTSVSLLSGSTRIALSGVLSTPSLVRATVPADTAPGLYDLELVTADGTARMTGAYRVVDAAARIEVVNVGQGDGTIVRSPSGRTLLIDGGNVGNGTNRIVPRLGGQQPDYVVVTHFDSDHLTGAYELLAGPDGRPNTADDVRPRVALLDHGDNNSCRSQLCRNYLDLRAQLVAAGKARTLNAGDVLDLGGGLRATCVFSSGRLPDGTRIYTGGENENSVGLLLELGGFRYYTGGDITGGSIPGCSAALVSNFSDVEGPAARVMGRVDAQKVSHHGSCTASALNFTGIAQPQVALVSVGTDNSYCHSARRVLYNYDRLGTDLLMTGPGVISPTNASGCPLTDRPPRVANVFGDLSLEIPATGLFTARASDGSQSWSRQYTVLEPTTAQAPLVSQWPDEQAIALVTSRTQLAVDAAVMVELQSAPLLAQATLLPWSALDDTQLARIEASQTPTGAVAAAVTTEGRLLRVAPTALLQPRTQYALVVPSRTSGLLRPLVVTFQSGAPKDRTGPKVKLTPPARGPEGALLNVRELALEFDEPVTGVDGQSVFLEELTASSDAVKGTVVGQGDGRRFSLQLPQGARTGRFGESCGALCPSLTYSVRLTGQVRDAAGNPAELTGAPTFDTGRCSDTGAPTLGALTTRTFATSLGVTIPSDEPIFGEVVLAPSGSFSSACNEQNPTSACVRVPINAGQCTTNGCTPAAEACTSWAAAKGLQPGVAYTIEVRAKDGIGLAAPGKSTSATPEASAGQLVLTEVMAAPPTSVSIQEEGEYVELVNAGTSPVDLCQYKLVKTNTTTSQVLCSGSQLLAPGAVAIVGGKSFKPSTYPSLPQDVLVVQVASNKLLSNGLANDPFPAISIQQSASGATVSAYPQTGKCPDGSPMERRAVEAPDLPGAFACGAIGGTPGAVAR